MKIALVGYGKMGKLLAQKVREKGWEVSAIVDPFWEQGLKDIAGIKADIAIEFTRPDTAVNNLLKLAEEKIPTVCGTTGWYEKLPEVKAAFEKAGSKLLYSSNFSLGVNLFYKICEYAAALLDPMAFYDVAAYEVHHNQKADSPSGTAKTLAEKVLAKMTRKQRAVYEMLNRKPAPEELHFPSLRVGSMPGIHALVFDSPADTIEIKHTNRNREGLADGALFAAEWLARQGSGIYTLDDAI
ncbi:MAG: 4-hydroxy-tetrahydrodipicolinate reductase [Spirochaetaceae bacterium]|jgi:4-hydroxy-tetrahydrodipicolinate reductase|nr:4-hydroxy-tetrahydrodipicolinate reductase [Spirochaetaceae bacterium]